MELLLAPEHVYHEQGARLNAVEGPNVVEKARLLQRLGSELIPHPCSPTEAKSLEFPPKHLLVACTCGR